MHTRNCYFYVALINILLPSYYTNKLLEYFKSFKVDSWFFFRVLIQKGNKLNNITETPLFVRLPVRPSVTCMTM